MVSFVYFDIGGVVIRDFSATDKMSQLKQELGIRPQQNEQFEQLWDKYEAQRCVGGDIESLLPLLKSQFHTSLPDNYSLLLDGFVKRFEPNQTLWPLINQIHQNCKVGLLTNMYTGMLTAIKQKGLLPDISWDAIVDSSIEKVKKPDPRIFAIAEQKAGVSGQEILFVENSSGHVAAAKDFGWQTFLYDSKNYDLATQALAALINQL